MVDVESGAGLRSEPTRLVLGTMPFGDTVPEVRARAIVEAAVAAGIEEIDTANTYAGGAGEPIVGRVLAEGGEGVAVSSKVGMQPATAPDRGPLSSAAIVASAEASVERVGRALDTLYLHQPDRSTELEDTLTGVAEVLDRGLAARFGLSNYSAWEMVEIQALSARLGLPEPRRAQQLYSALARRLELEFLPYAVDRDIETVVYNPLAGGLLTGRYRHDDEPESGRFGTSALAAMYRKRYWNHAQFTALEELRAIAAQAAVPMAELALRWLIGTPGVSAILIGASTPEQLRANIEALGRGGLDAEVRAAIDAATGVLLSTSPQYAR
ncbi:aldo/keto reductase [Ruania alba]|uniref:Predicted oxidoreductase n=1 Tax=Ruania alba TaxID=648782 RepID=A0A1H5LEQ5_9MICO|nr:aldo/keto reductase [Ruania alba]SEE75027.1 Predicted oxidoreductase [Ruania alba]